MRLCHVWPQPAAAGLTVRAASSSKLSRKGNLNFGRILAHVISHTEEEETSSSAGAVKSIHSGNFFVKTPEQVGVRDETRGPRCLSPPSITSLLFLLLWAVFWTSALE